jgi:hypothetical protein
MPGKTTERSEQIETPFGRIEGRSFSASRGRVEFHVSYNDYPPDVPDFVPDRVLDRVAGRAAGGVPGAVVGGTTVLKLGDVPGREFEFAFPLNEEEDGLCRGQYYLSRRRLYSVMLRGPAVQVARVAPAFFRSFGLFPPEAKAAAKPAPALPPSAFTTKPGAAAKVAATKVYTSTAGGFRVAMPGKPQERTVVAEAHGVVVEAHLLVVVVDDVRRLVSYIERPKPLDPGEVDAALEELVKGSIQSGKGTLVAKRPIQLGAIPGREFEFDSVGLDGRPRYVRARAYLDGARIYQVLIAGPKAKVAGAAGDAFLGSFALPRP